MDRGTTNKICTSYSVGRGAKFLKSRNKILKRLTKLVRQRESERKLGTSDFFVSQVDNYHPLDIRSLLCEHNFLLTNKGWRVKMKGRILYWDTSPSGIIIIEEDLLHTTIPNYGRRGDYIVRYYSITKKEAFGTKFHIWHEQLKGQVDV